MQATGLPTWAVFDEKRSVLKLAIYCQPGAKQTQIQGLHDGRLKIRLMAAPVDGAANDALLDFLVKKLLILRVNFPAFFPKHICIQSQMVLVQL